MSDQVRKQELQQLIEWCESEAAANNRAANRTSTTLEREEYEKEFWRFAGRASAFEDVAVRIRSRLAGCSDEELAIAPDGDADLGPYKPRLAERTPYRASMAEKDFLDEMIDERASDNPAFPQMVESAARRSEDARAGPPRWRVGRTLGRTLYIGEQLVGMVDTPELAERIVEAMNAGDGATCEGCGSLDPEICLDSHGYDRSDKGHPGAHPHRPSCCQNSFHDDCTAQTRAQPEAPRG